MKKGDILKSKVEFIDFPNKSILNLEKPTTVKERVIPGQEVEVRITKNRKDRAEAELLRVIQPSPVEINTPSCSFFDFCGGCFYQRLPYNEQLKIKETTVKNLIKEYAGVHNYDGIISSPLTSDYRNKMELSFGDEIKGGSLALGLHKKRSKFDILDVHDCSIMSEDFRKIRNATIDFAREKELSFYHKISHMGYLRHLVLRQGFYTNEILVNLVTSSQNDIELSLWVSMLLSLNTKPKIVGILHTTNDSLSDAVINQGVRILYGRDYYYEELLGLKFKISAFSFFQTNTYGAELLYSKVIEYVKLADESSVVFDLYSGTGTIAQLVSKVSKEVYGVEIVEEAVKSAITNAELNNLSNCKFYAGDVLNCIDNIKVQPNLIIVDPPREGIHPKSIKKILNFGVKNIIYISCKPTSLKNDLKEIYDAGYQIKRWGLVDMFPQTLGIETVVLLSKLEVDK